MSIVSDDRKVLEKRKNKLPDDVAVPLRDRIPAKLKQKLDEMGYGPKAVELWTLGNMVRAEWLERQEKYLGAWDEFLVPNTNGAFSHSSNLHIPMPFIVAKTYHARFMQAVAGEDTFGVDSRINDEALHDRAKMIEKLMQYTISEWANARKGIEETLDAWLWSWITTGAGVKKWRWDVQYTRFMDIETRIVPAAPRTMIDEQGNERVIPQLKTEEVEVAKVKEVVNGPECVWVDNKDFIILGGEGDPDRADVKIHRQYLTASDLWTLADRRIFDEEVVEEIIRSGPDMKGTDQSDQLSQHSASAAGLEPNHEADLDRYEILECYVKVDVDQSGINTDVVVWVHKSTSKILRATYLHRISKSGEQPFVKIDFHRRPGQEWGIGLVETLYPLSKELDAIRNIRIDNGILSTMPFGFYRATSSLDPETISLEPGALIPVDNPQTDVFFPNLGNRTSFGIQEEQIIQATVERMTGLSDLSFGAMSGQQGPTRTATGARALMMESNANLDVHWKRLNRGLKKSYEYLFHMLQQRIPPGLSFRVTGEDGHNYWASVRDASDLAGDFDFRVAPHSSDSNPTVRMQNAQTVLQVVSNPLFIQMGLVTPQHIHEAVKNLFKVQGVRDFARYIQAPPQMMRILTPEEEAQRILRGINVPVGPEGDHEGFIAYFEFIKKTPQILAHFSQEDVSRLAAHAQAHARMKQALDQMAAQQANVSQMQANQAMGALPNQALLPNLFELSGGA